MTWYLPTRDIILLAKYYNAKMSQTPYVSFITQYQAHIDEARAKFTIYPKNIDLKLLPPKNCILRESNTPNNITMACKNEDGEILNYRILYDPQSGQVYFFDNYRYDSISELITNTLNNIQYNLYA